MQKKLPGGKGRSTQKATGHRPGQETETKGQRSAGDDLAVHAADSREDAKGNAAGSKGADAADNIAAAARPRSLMAVFKCETAGSAKRSWRQADAAIDTAEGFDANHQQGSPSVLRVASPAETSRNEGDDEEPPADWTKSKIDWQWEQARRTRFERVVQKISGSKANDTGIRTEPDSEKLPDESQCQFAPAPHDEAAGDQEERAADGHNRGAASVKQSTLITSCHVDTALMCPQCCGYYTATGGDLTPKLLPCFHSVCAACTIALLKRKASDRRCPTCRFEIKHEEFPLNLVVTGMLEDERLSNSGPRVCSNECIGDDAYATGFCEDCKSFLCDACVSMHSRQRATTAHCVRILDQLKDSDPKSSRRFRKLCQDSVCERCAEHADQKLDLFCTTCGVMVCPKCALVHHSPPAHTLKALETMMAETQIEIKTMTGTCGAVERRQEQNLSAIRRLRFLMLEDAGRTKSQIETLKTELVEHANRKAEEALRMLKQEQKRAESELGAREQDVLCLLRRVTNLSDFAQKALEMTNNKHILASRSSLLSCLSACLKENEDAAVLQPPSFVMGTAATALETAVQLLRPQDAEGERGSKSGDKEAETVLIMKMRAEFEAEREALQGELRSRHSREMELEQALAEAKATLRSERMDREKERRAVESLLEESRDAALAEHRELEDECHLLAADLKATAADLQSVTEERNALQEKVSELQVCNSLKTDPRSSVQIQEELIAHLRENQESAEPAVAELQRVIDFDTGLHSGLQTEREAAKSSHESFAAEPNIPPPPSSSPVSEVMSVSPSSLIGEVVTESASNPNDLCPLAREQLNTIAEELEATAAEWRSKYDNLQLTAEVLRGRIKSGIEVLLEQLLFCITESDDTIRLVHAWAAAGKVGWVGPGVWLERESSGGVEPRYLPEDQAGEHHRVAEFSDNQSAILTQVPGGPSPVKSVIVEERKEVPCITSPSLLTSDVTRRLMEEMGGVQVRRDDRAKGKEQGEIETVDERENNSRALQQLLEFEIKAIRAEYESAHDRWSRERETMLGELSALRMIDRDVTGSCEKFPRNDPEESASELMMLRSEYQGALDRWDQERQELRAQVQNVLQACMEAEIATEQGRKREEALHAALLSQNRAGTTASLSANGSGVSFLEMERSISDGINVPIVHDEDIIDHVPRNLLSPDLHSQRQAHLAGKTHGGSFSRNVVEEMVEKMEKTPKSLPCNTRKLKEHLNEEIDTIRVTSTKPGSSLQQSLSEMTEHNVRAQSDLHELIQLQLSQKQVTEGGSLRPSSTPQPEKTTSAVVSETSEDNLRSSMGMLRDQLAQNKFGLEPDPDESDLRHPKRVPRELPSEDQDRVAKGNDLHWV